jgi:hypothetical protein
MGLFDDVDWSLPLDDTSFLDGSSLTPPDTSSDIGNPIISDSGSQTDLGPLLSSQAPSDYMSERARRAATPPAASAQPPVTLSDRSGFTGEPQQKALLDAIGGGEAQRFDERNRGGGSALGHYQMLARTQMEQAAKLGITPQQMMSDPDRYGNQAHGAWRLLADKALAKTGQPLNDLLMQQRARTATDAIKGLYPSVPGGSQPNVHTPGYFNRYTDARERYGIGGMRRYPEMLTNPFDLRRPMPGI